MLKTWLVLATATVLVITAVDQTPSTFKRLTGCLNQHFSSAEIDARSMIECMTACLKVAEKCYAVSYNSELNRCYMSNYWDTDCQNPTTIYYIEGHCPVTYIWNPHSKTCFQLGEGLKTWQDANSSCCSNGEYLVTFPTAASSLWLSSKAVELSTDNSAWIWNLWIGVTKGATECHWQGLLTGIVPGNGEPGSDWQGNQPVYGTSEDCVTIQATGDYRGWHDYPCGTTHNFMCETDTFTV